MDCARAQALLTGHEYVWERLESYDTLDKNEVVATNQDPRTEGTQEYVCEKLVELINRYENII